MLTSTIAYVLTKFWISLACYLHFLGVRKNPGAKMKEDLGSASMDVSDNLTDYGSVIFMNETAQLVMQVLPRIVMILIAITGLSGNCLVLYIIIKHRDMRTVTNYFVANLAITDITFLILCVIPTVIVIGAPSWPLGGFICRINSYFQYVSSVCYQSSILLLLPFSHINANKCNCWLFLFQEHPLIIK